MYYSCLDKVLHGTAFDAAVTVFYFDCDISDVTILVHVNRLVDRAELSLANGVLNMDCLKWNVVSAVTHSSREKKIIREISAIILEDIFVSS